MSSGFIGLNLTAFNGGGQANALAIPASQTYSEVATVANAADSIKLPASIPAGSVYFFRNDGANSMNIFPPVGGQINALGANTAIACASGATASFVSGASNQFYSYNNSPVAPLPAAAPVIVWAGAQNLTVGQSGSLVILPNVATGALTLPAVAGAAGVYYQLRCRGAVSNANHVTITAPNGTLNGAISGAAAVASANGQNTCQLGNATGAMAVGDNLFLICDGTNWYISGTVADTTHLIIV